MTTDISEVLDTLRRHDCLSEISFSDALGIIQQEKDWSLYIAELEPNPEDISNLITFTNSNLIAYELVFENPIAAKALYEELKYYVDNKVI